METEVARKIENSVATLQGIKHIYTKVQDGTAIVTVEFRLEKPTQEAVDDVRDAVSRIRADLPGDLQGSGDFQGQPGRRADPHLHRRLEPHGRRGAVVVRRQHRHQGHAQRARRRCGGARRRRHPRNPRRTRPGPPARAARHGGRCLAPVAPDPAGSLGRAAPMSAASSNRCAPSPPCSRPRNSAPWKLRSPTAAACASSELATVSDTVTEQRCAALLNGKPVVGFEIVRARGAGEVDVTDGVRAALAKAQGRAPGHHHHRGLQFRRSGESRTSKARWRC